MKPRMRLLASSAAAFYHCAFDSQNPLRHQCLLPCLLPSDFEGGFFAMPQLLGVTHRPVSWLMMRRIRRDQTGFRSLWLSSQSWLRRCRLSVPARPACHDRCRAVRHRRNPVLHSGHPPLALLLAKNLFLLRASSTITTMTGRRFTRLIPDWA